MEQDTIRSLVIKKVEKWQKNLRPIKPSLSAKAIELIVELIVNIKEDPSPAWRKITEDNYKDYQDKAISLIPKALSRTFGGYGFTNYDQEVSVWEVYSSLSYVLARFCFIPEKDM